MHNEQLTTEQAAHYLRDNQYQPKRTVAVQPDTIQRWCWSGKIKASKHGDGKRGVWLIPRSELDRLIAEQQEGQKDADNSRS